MLITRKGQVTIPQRIREQHGLKPGTAVEIVTERGQVLIRARKRSKNPVNDWLAQATGVAKGKITTDKLLRLTRGED